MGDLAQRRGSYDVAIERLSRARKSCKSHWEGGDAQVYFDLAGNQREALLALGKAGLERCCQRGRRVALCLHLGLHPVPTIPWTSSR